MAYSATDIVYPQITSSRMQTLATYQTSSCSATTPIARYYRTGTALARQGVEWFDTIEYTNGDWDASPPVSLYNQQLPPDAGSSTHIKVFRPSTDTGVAATLARLQVTYYVTYKGTKGLGPITKP